MEQYFLLNVAETYLFQIPELFIVDYLNTGIVEAGVVACDFPKQFHGVVEKSVFYVVCVVGLVLDGFF